MCLIIGLIIKNGTNLALWQAEFNASNRHGNEKFQCVGCVIFPNKSGKSLKYWIEQKIIPITTYLAF